MEAYSVAKQNKLGLQQHLQKALLLAQIMFYPFSWLWKASKAFKKMDTGMWSCSGHVREHWQGDQLEDYGSGTSRTDKDLIWL